MAFLYGRLAAKNGGVPARAGSGGDAGVRASAVHPNPGDRRGLVAARGGPPRVVKTKEFCSNTTSKVPEVGAVMEKLVECQDNHERLN